MREVGRGRRSRKRMQKERIKEETVIKIFKTVFAL